MIFVTGTDTEIGKTHISQALLHGWFETYGLAANIRKPVLSGDLGVDNDALRLIEASRTQQTLDEVAPYRFQPPVSPDLAIEQAGLSVSKNELVELCRNSDWVEGAGGYLSPICSDALNADLADSLEARLMVVIGLKLGCINHALLTLSEIHRRQQPVHSIILNCLDANASNLQHTHRVIQSHSPVQSPIFIAPYSSSYQQVWQALFEQGFTWPTANKL